MKEGGDGLPLMVLPLLVVIRLNSFWVEEKRWESWLAEERNERAQFSIEGLG